MNEIDFEQDDFADVIAKDARYDAHAYALLMDVINALGSQRDERDEKEADDEPRHVSAEEILDEFRGTVLDQYGPLSYRVLTEWGLKSTADIGEMMFNLVENRRIGRDEGDEYSDFAEAYDFREAFLDPYET